MNSHHRLLCSCPVYRRDPYWVHCCFRFTFNPLVTLYEAMTYSTTNRTPLLRTLYWLPVARRIQYKIVLLSCKITHRHAPFYLRDMLSSYQPTRCLRPSSSNALVVPRMRGKAGDAAFAVAVPRLWNALPHQLKCVANINISIKRYVSLTLTC